MEKKQLAYATILADPPWDVEQRGARGAVKHYNVEPLERIKSMPVTDFCQENAHCWLWVTNATLEHGFAVLRAWGFTPRSIFTWIKPRFTLGVYLRNATEHVLFGTRGKAPILFKSQPTWGFFPLQDHSHKPEELHKIIERCSPGPRIELFTRRRTSGWDVWGDEIDSDIVIPGCPVPKYSAKANLKNTEKGAVHE